MHPKQIMLFGLGTALYYSWNSRKKNATMWTGAGLLLMIFPNEIARAVKTGPYASGGISGNWIDDPIFKK